MNVKSTKRYGDKCYKQNNLTVGMFNVYSN